MNLFHLWITFILLIQMTSTFDTCYKHAKPYQFIGNDLYCPLNCRICFECLRGVDNAHKKGVYNHETISTQQLALHFQRLQRYSQDSIIECNQAIQRYFHSFETLLRDEIDRQKARINKLMRKILLAGITKDDRKLDVILNLFNQDFAEITCRQVAEVSDLLFNFVPKNNQAGFKTLLDHIHTKQTEVQNAFEEIIQGKTWKKTFLKSIETDISFPDFEEPKRIKTQETPGKTLRKSVKKTPKGELKDISVELKKPLNLNGSRLVENRDQSLFMSKLFQHKNVHSAHLLFRASEHNFSIKDFHQLCDGQSNTLVLVKTEFNKIIGGFTPIPWRSTANTLHSDVRCQSFLFSLSLKQKMCLIDQKSAIFNSVNFGPTFGAGADLAICHNGNVQKTSYCQFPYSYANSRYKQSNQHTTALFTGQKNGNHFLLKQWEVWKINFE